MRAYSITAVLSLLLMLLWGAETSALSQTGKKLSAREIFYAAPKAAAAPAESAPQIQEAVNRCGRQKASPVQYATGKRARGCATVR